MQRSFAVALCTMLFNDSIQAVKIQSTSTSEVSSNSANHAKNQRLGQIKMQIQKTPGSSESFLKRKQKHSDDETTMMTQVSLSSSTEQNPEETGQVDLGLDNTHNFTYKATLNIGSPPQPVRAIMDTGSAQTWILSNAGVTEEEAEDHQTFNPDESSTFKEEPDLGEDEISFGSGDLSGYYGYDLITLGDVDSEESLKVQKQLFGVVDEQDVFTSQFDAIVGLAYPAMAGDETTPLMDSMIEQGVLAENVFAFYMSMNPEEEPSELVFGHIDEDRYDGDINWHDVRYPLFWNLKLDDVKINGESLNICEGKKDCFVTVDSGTTNLTVPSWAKDTFDEHFKSQTCESDEDFGDLTYIIDGIEYSIPSNHWVSRKVYPNSKDICTSLINTLDVGMDREENLFIVGDVFMQIWYSIFDRDNDRVGLAKAHHNEEEIKIDKTQSGDLIDQDGNVVE